MKSSPLGWAGIVRLGLVQSALGAMVVFATGSLNRIMVVEEAMPAVLPAALVAWHYVVQLSRPRWGYGSDVGTRRTPWIIGGMGVLALGLVIATDAAVMMGHSPLTAVLLALLGYSMIGAGVAASGTTLLALLASRVAPERRPAAAAITWIMMIVGFIICAATTGALLQPFSAQRLAMLASGVAGVGFLVSIAAVWGTERGDEAIPEPPVHAPPRPSFQTAIAEIRADPVARRFTLFIFASMLAYSAQELILEPFAGLVFHLNPGQSAFLNAFQQGGALVGMILVGAIGARFGDRKSLWMRRWTVLGCVGSALALCGLGAASVVGPGWPLPPTMLILGLANGVFAVSAIGSMMGLAGAGRTSGEGVRMGVWGAAQAIAFAFGGFLGAFGVDVLRGVLHQPAPAFLVIFGLEAIMFLVSAILAGGVGRPAIAGAAPERAASPSLELEGAPL